jgi:hypothetical protein
MQVAVRSCLTAGVSLVGAGALLISPISPSAPATIQVPAISSAMVELAASTNPIQQWVDVVTGTVTNMVGIGSAVVADPAPILRAVLTNQLGYAQTVVNSLEALGDSLSLWGTDVVVSQLQILVTDLSQGNTVGAANAVNTMIGALVFAAFPVAEILTIPRQMADTLVRVVTAATDLFTVLLPLAIGALGPIMGTIEMLGDQSQAVLNAIGAGDPLAALSAIINTPGVLAGGILNGYTAAYEVDGYKTFFPGLLTFDPAAPQNNGIFASLLVTIPKIIANALAGPATTVQRTAETTETPADGVASLPDLAAQTVSLNSPAEAPETDPGTASGTPADEAATGADTESAPQESAPQESAPQESAPQESEEASAEKEKPADTRINTKKGNKVVPGQVKTGVADNDSSPTTEAEPTATDDNTGTTGTDATGSDNSESNDSGNTDGGGSDE